MPLPPTRERPVTNAGDLGQTGRRRGGWRRIGRIVLIATLVLAATALGAVAAVYVVAQRSVDELLTPKSADTRAAQKVLAEPIANEPANILLLGSDKRVKDTEEGGSRSDTLMLVRLDPKNETVSVLSFPRDLYVEIPDYGTAKINEAYSSGGSKRAVETVQDLTGLPIHYVVNVDFVGFRSLVNKFGGVYVDVDRDYFNEGGDYAAIDVQAGYQRLNGQDALDFARFRHTDSDFHRIARQQLVIEGLKKQVTRDRALAKGRAIFDIIRKNTDMATGGDGSISVRTAVEYINLARKLDDRSIFRFQVDGNVGEVGGASIVEADQATIDAAVDAFLSPSKDEQKKSVENVTGEKLPDDEAQNDDESGSVSVTPSVDPSTVTVSVLNGSGISGAAAETASALAALGYMATSGGDASRTDFEQTVVIYADPDEKAGAEAVAELFENSTVRQTQAGDPTPPAGVVVITGTSTEPPTGDGETDEATPPVKNDTNVAPEKAPAAVITDPLYGIGEFNAVDDAVKMPVLYPTVREQNSTYEFPIRTYKIHQYEAYRLVARTANGDYWGLQATAWPDPPLLENATREIQRKGRNYMLYFNGTHLHRVAWRQRGSVYWVTNSLRDDLSNETVLAIADGVKPLPRR